MIAIEGYERLRKIEEKDHYTLFSGRHIADSRQVLLKQYGENHSPESNHQALVHIYRTLKSTASPHLVPILDILHRRSPAEKSPIVVFQAPAGIQLSQYLESAHPLPN